MSHLKDHPDLRALAQLTVNLQLCVMLLNDVFNDGQSQSGTAGGLGTALVHTVKALKNMGQPVRWDGRAGAVHRQNRLAARCGQPQGHGADGARVLDGIIQQDHRQPMQGGGIPLHGLAGVRPLQSGYSPANLLRLSSIYRYSIPQSAENRLKGLILKSFSTVQPSAHGLGHIHQINQKNP